MKVHSPTAAGPAPTSLCIQTFLPHYVIAAEERVKKSVAGRAAEHPRDMHGRQHDHHYHAHGATPGYAVVTVSRGHTLLVEIAPARAGANALTLSLSDADGQPFAPVEVTVALSMPAAGIEPLVRVPARTGEGRYALARLDLPTSGRWSIRVDALISDFEKLIFTTEVPIR
jgi:hypothetical protein